MKRQCTGIYPQASETIIFRTMNLHGSDDLPYEYALREDLAAISRAGRDHGSREDPDVRQREASRKLGSRFIKDNL